MSAVSEIWMRVLALDDLAEGAMVGLEVAGQHVALYNVGGEILATDNICSHAFALLSDGWLDDGIVECPLHGGRFEVRSGKALGDPVTCDIRTFRARIADGHIEVLLSPKS